jgi:hypothetical protein
MKPVHANRPTYFTGLDFGQTHEFTALAVVERTIVEGTNPVLRRYAVRHLQRFTMGTPYAEIASHVATMFAHPLLKQSRLVVDQTMVGRPVVAELRRAKVLAQISVLAVTAGMHSGVGDHGVLMVAKQELVSTVQILLQSHRLTVAASLPESRVLADELVNFKLKRPPSSDNIADWSDAPHDDLVFAVAIAVWQGEREPSPVVMKGVVARSGCPGMLPEGWWTDWH